MVDAICSILSGYYKKEKLIRKGMKQGGDFLYLRDSQNLIETIRNKYILEIKMYLVLNVFYAALGGISFLSLVMLSLIEPMMIPDYHSYYVVFAIMFAVFLFSFSQFFPILTKIENLESKLEKIEKFLS